MHGELPFDGAPPVEVRTSTRRKKTVGAHWEGDTVVVVFPHRMAVKHRRAYVDDLVARLVAQRAKQRPSDEHLLARALELSAQYLDGRVHPTSVTWSSRQRARWGSCSASDGTIRISDRLQAVPTWVLDSVLVHELAHLLHADHSRDFHDLAERFPRMAEADLFLEGYALGLAHPQQPTAR